MRGKLEPLRHSKISYTEVIKYVKFKDKRANQGAHALTQSGAKKIINKMNELIKYVLGREAQQEAKARKDDTDQE